MLEGKTVLIAITGGIAAYKICDLIRKFKREKANVRVLLTPNALNFVTGLTMANLSQNPVITDKIEWENFRPEHISLTEEADILIIAPATANTVSKIAQGICDNLLTTTVCAFKKPVIIAPAMNSNMWSNDIIQANMKILRKKYEILEPESGFLACNHIGQGRLCKTEKIFNRAVSVLSNSKRLEGKKIVVTAGGTIEKIDSVRYISNFSSGKMGLALADAAHEMGAAVTLVSTNDVARPYPVAKVQSATDMQKIVEEEFKTADSLIMAAAVVDFRPKKQESEKIKKTKNDEISIEFIKNPDILKTICENKGEKLVVGFCAETSNLENFAKEKIQKKGCDFIIANDISRSDIGFGAEENEVLIVDKNLNVKKLEKNSKTIIAKQILEEIYG